MRLHIDRRAVLVDDRVDAAAARGALPAAPPFRLVALLAVPAAAVLRAADEGDAADLVDGVGRLVQPGLEGVQDRAVAAVLCEPPIERSCGPVQGHLLVERHRDVLQAQHVGGDVRVGTQPLFVTVAGGAETPENGQVIEN
ncbi:hypothetical protein [Streptomyces sp. 5K101]|uniref:hypothetical protein n=1 Tax=Streptomyces sp. 5K101 TaxID=3390037 RepID=UPI00397546D4